MQVFREAVQKSLSFEADRLLPEPSEPLHIQAVSPPFAG
jgi:hypothetical protein